MTENTPALSAAFVMGAQRDRVGRCVTNLLAQTALESMEIIAVDLAPDHALPAGFDHARVRRIAYGGVPNYAAAQQVSPVKAPLRPCRSPLRTGKP